MAALTIKQETFCQKYIETGSASEAYRQAYSPKGKPETINKRASELLANGAVAGRVSELRGDVQKAHGVTVASLIAELEEARMVAKGREQGAAMVAATMGKAKLTGLEGEAEKPANDLAKAMSDLIAKLPG